MAFYDRVRQNTATTGTADMVLGNPVAQFRSVAGAGVSNAEVVRYVIEDANGGWEINSGAYTTSSTTLARGTPSSSSASGNAKITLSGSAIVTLLPSAADFAAFALLAGAAFTGALSAPTLAVSGSASVGGASTLRQFNVVGSVSTNFFALGLSNNAATADDSHGCSILATNSGNSYRNYLALYGSSIRFMPADVEAARIDNNGNAMFGTTTASGKMTVLAPLDYPAVFATTTSTYSAVAAVSGTNTMNDLNGPGISYGVYGAAKSNLNSSSTAGRTMAGYFVNTAAAGGLAAGVAAFSSNGPSLIAGTAFGTYTFIVNNDGSTTPGKDNTQTLGSASLRWSVVYAGSATISTSDGTLKTVRAGGMTDQERAWAKAIQIVPYQFNDAIAEKGVAKARLHWGVIAQDLYAAGIAAGITDPFAYGFLCQDPLTKTETTSVTLKRQVIEQVTQQQNSYEVVDGKAVLNVVDVVVDQPAFDILPVVDAAGAPVMVLFAPARPAVPAEVADDGSVITPAQEATEDVYRQATYAVPRFEDVTEEHHTEVPALDADGNQIMRWGVRYEELAMFLEAARSA